MPEPLADEALYAKGLAVLEDCLGPVDALRFFALIGRQPFDYQHWRQQHFGAMSLVESSYRPRHSPSVHKEGAERSVFCVRRTSCCRTHPMVKTARTASMRLPIATEGIAPCSPVISATKSTASGTPSGPVASPIHSKSWSRSPICSSCAASMTSRRWRKTNPPGSDGPSSAASSRRATTHAVSPTHSYAGRASSTPRRARCSLSSASTSFRSCVPWAATTPPMRTT